MSLHGILTLQIGSKILSLLFIPDGQTKIKVLVHILRFEAALLALDVAHRGALIQIANSSAFLPCDGKALLDCVEQHSAELLSVMLLEGLRALPPEALSKAPRICRPLPG